MLRRAPSSGVGAAAPVRRAAAARRATVAPHQLRPCAAAAASSDGAAAPDPPGPANGGKTGGGPLAALRRFVFGSKDAKVDRAAIAKLGAGGFLSYGFISNVNYGVAIGISWIAFVKKYGVSPLGDQWPTFLAFYAGMWTLQNFLRPMRLGLAIALAPSANRLIDRVGEKTGLGRKAGFGILLATMAVTMTSLLATALWAFGGFPPPPSK